MIQSNQQQKPTGAKAAPAWGRRALEQLRNEGEFLDDSGLRIRLARAYGFCQGVKRAVELAMQAAEELTQVTHAGKTATLRGDHVRPRLFMTGEIIHNPSTNEQLRKAGVVILPPPGDPSRLSLIRSTDWVIVPAFGITTGEEKELRQIGCRIIDTTCGWVQRIWKTVRRFSTGGLTTVIHGKVEHEETRASASRIVGPYVIVRNREEAELLAAAVRREPLQRAGAGGTRTVTDWPEWFEAPFASRCSSGFDPEHDLDRLGLVNQTTMLSSETEAIAEILNGAMAARSVPGESTDMSGPGRFRTLDTFCPATQKRQDAVRELLAQGAVDAMIVVGGFLSSNTSHLAELGSGRVPTFHVEDASCLINDQQIRHLPIGTREPVITRGWRPRPPCTIGVTAGASTPEPEAEGVLLRLLALYRGEAP